MRGYTLRMREGTLFSPIRRSVPITQVEFKKNRIRLRCDNALLIVGPRSSALKHKDRAVRPEMHGSIRRTLRSTGASVHSAEKNCSQNIVASAGIWAHKRGPAIFSVPNSHDLIRTRLTGTNVTDEVRQRNTQLDIFATITKAVECRFPPFITGPRPERFKHGAYFLTARCKDASKCLAWDSFWQSG
jgi:hypothetical protein